MEEFPSVGRLASSKHEELRELVEAIAQTSPDDDWFVFGWSSHMDLMNSITLYSVKSLPALILINSSSLQFFTVEGRILPQDILEYMDHVRTGQLPVSYEALFRTIMMITFLLNSSKEATLFGSDTSGNFMTLSRPS